MLSGRQSPSSLFSSSSEDGIDAQKPLGRHGSDDREHEAINAADPPATRRIPAIPGLWIFPELLSPDVAQKTLAGISAAAVFLGGARDQVMLFTRRSKDTSALPVWLFALLQELGDLLLPLIPADVHRMLFDQPLARQAILNLYPPGEGIASHVDLPSRYADGILGVSIIGGCVITFTEVGGERVKHNVYLPPRSVYVMNGPARWGWEHGIPARREDLVVSDTGKEVTMLRDVRVSATFRWMQEGADVLS